MIRGRHRRARETIENDLEILPLMNLFVVLIPMLLLSAVFIELAVIKMGLPGDDAPANDEPTLGLAIAIENSQWIVRGRSLAAQTVDRTAEGAEDELRDVLLAVRESHAQTRDVTVESHATTRYEDIVTVMDVARDAGLPGISLAQTSSGAEGGSR